MQLSLQIDQDQRCTFIDPVRRVTGTWTGGDGGFIITAEGASHFASINESGALILIPVVNSYNFV